MKSFKKKEFIIFDVETTGLSPRTGDRIVEIAALKIKNLKLVEEFYSFVDPEREISFGAFQVNGITQDMLIGAPKSREILPRFLEFMGDAALVGHNISFDLGFLCHELSLIGMRLKDKTIIIDTLKMARNLLPHLGRYPLWLIADSLGVHMDQEHRAMADVHLTFKVFYKLIKTMGEKDINEIGVLSNILNDYKGVSQERIFN